MPAPHTRMHAQILHTSCCDMLFMPISIVYFDNDDPRGLSVKHGNIVGIVEETQDYLKVTTWYIDICD